MITRATLRIPPREDGRGIDDCFHLVLGSVFIDESMLSMPKSNGCPGRDSRVTPITFSQHKQPRFHLVGSLNLKIDCGDCSMSIPQSSIFLSFTYPACWRLGVNVVCVLYI